MGLRVVFLGTGASVLAGSRAKSSVYVEAGSTRLLIDAGPPLQQRLFEEGIDPTCIDAIIITHVHQDHLFGLPGLLYEIEARGITSSPLIIVPAGSSSAIKEMLRLFGPSKMRYSTRLIEGEEHEMSIGDVQLLFRKVKHPIPTYAVRIEYGGAGLFYSSDTMYMPELEKLASCDIAIHEATIPEEMEERAWSIGGHSSPRQALRVIRNASIRVLTHISELSFASKRDYDISFITAADGLEIRI